MAGRKKTGTKPDKRGGARPGSGRKKETLSQNQVNEMLSDAKKRAKEKGQSINDILLDIIYTDHKRSKTVTVKDRLAAIKLWKDFTMSKVSEQNVNVQTVQGPSIGLPPMREDPALKVVKGGKK